MSTKDLRFILPIFPSLCIFFGFFITNLKNYNWSKFYKIFIVLIILSKLILHLFLQKNIVLNFTKISKPYWPHKEIIEKVSRFSPYSKSVIAVLPDTKELNTFNLASEANMQNSNIYIRQIISNENSYKDDLDRFNWFLLKDGEQGVMSNNSKLVWETELANKDYEDYPFKIYGKSDFMAPFASGSAKFNSMVVVPCSMGTIGRIAHGISDDLITRAADVILKERRKLILVARETPYNLIHLNNMKLITEAGGIICPASPSFYSNPMNIEELAMTVVNRVIDLLEIENTSFRWGEKY